MCRKAAFSLVIVLLIAASAYAQTPTALATVSTRAHVGTTDDQLISGWILSESGNANVLIRGLGPSLPNVSGPLADPVLSLFDMNGEQIYSNDNWKDSPQRAAIEATGRQPTNDLESAILAPLPAGQFTSVVTGKNNTTGIAKVEMIDLDPSSAPSIVNKSTRARAGTGNAAPLDEFVIAGSEPRKVIIRGIGPSLRSAFVADYLPDPTLTLRDSSGQLLVFNNNWRDTQQAEVQASNLAPTENAESAIVATLAPGTYTAELQGLCGGTGVGLIEVFYLDSGTTPSVPASSHVLSCGPEAPSVVVTNTNDSGAGSLRAAIAAAPPGGTIGFSKSTSEGAVNFYDGNPHTITLTSGALTIDKSLSIAAPNPHLLTVSGNRASRVFFVNSGATVAIDNLKISDGAILSTGNNAGAGIRNAGILTISNCIVSNCSTSGTGATSNTPENTEGGGISNVGTLSILDTSIINNAAGAGGLNQGGGVSNRDGTLTISNSIISGNSVTAPDGGNSYGAGIYNWGGSVTVSGGTIAGNACNGGRVELRSGTGGGIYSYQGSLAIRDTKISGNTVAAAGPARGGGIWSVAGAATTITRSTIQGNSLNSRTQAEGGGIYVSGDLVVLDSTISNNSARRGGGIYFGSSSIAVMTITNSTIAENSANPTSGGTTAAGAGIFNDYGTAYLTGVTIAANVVSADASGSHGGGVHSVALPPETSSRLHCRDTIIAANTAGTGPDIAGSIISRGHNLIGNTAGATITGDTTGNVLDRNAHLGSLADNGGPTKTMRVLPGSPAIDAGGDFTTLASATDASSTTITVANATAFPAAVGFVLRIDAEQMIVTAKSGNTLTVTRGANGTAAAAHSAGASVNPASDQRGQPRKAGNAVDIGAFETNYALSVTSGGTQATTVGSAFGSMLQLRITDNGQPLAGIAVTFTAPSSGATGTFANGSTSVTVLTDNNGFATAPAFTANTKTGSYAVMVTFNGSASSISYQLTNNPGPAARLIVSAPGTVEADTPFSFTVTAVDQFGNVVSGYSGRVRFASSDPNASLPSDATLTNGTGTFTATLKSGGNHTISATDEAGGSVTGSSTAISVPEAQPLNISTRLNVLTGENVLIGGFFITGNAPKKVIIRAIGPSLTAGGEPLPGRLPDTRLELFDAAGETIATNDDWKIDSASGQSQQAQVEATSVPPSSDAESALVRTLNPGAYTAIVSGKDAATGIALVEVYDLDSTADSRFANISTRGFVDTGDNVMIGGFILGGANAGSSVLVRGIGPSLADSGVAGALEDPRLELYNADGQVVAANDDWKTDEASGQSQQATIEATTIPPANELESAILMTLPPGAYTAILSGKGGATGVGLVELYNLK